MKKRLYRSESNRQIAGVCGGIAEYFNLDDATIIRLIWAILSCIWGIGILIYIICALVIPTESDVWDSSQKADYKREQEEKIKAKEAKKAQSENKTNADGTINANSEEKKD
jgi:phage shock protein C